MAPIVQLSTANVVVDIDVGNGGRIAQIRVGETALLVDQRPDPTGWGSYPMAPWAGRVRHGRFRHFGSDHLLRLHPGSDHAMHGTVLSVPWTVEEQTGSVIGLACHLDQPGSGWPFGGVAHQRIEVLAHQLRCDLSVSVDHANSGRHSTPFPAMVGWHPWWRKPDTLTFHPDAMYERDASGLPTGRLVAPSGGPWDDCFVNTAPVTLHYERAEAADITISSDCDHWVVYDEPVHATCVEPQSGPPDEFNLRPQIVTDTHPLRHTMIVGW